MSQAISDKHARSSPEVDGNSAQGKEENEWLRRLLRATVFGKSPCNAYLRLNEALWKRLPWSISASRPMRLYGNFIHRIVRARGRAQAFGTFFFRNRPQLELIRRLVNQSRKGARFQVAILGCSTGPEVYSVTGTIRSARPDLELVITAADISEEAVETAKHGIYSLSCAKLGGTAVCEKMSPVEMDEFFKRNGDDVAIKPWLKEGINWRVEDAGDSKIIDSIGRQKLVVANNFLCHMKPLQAETCLRNIARLVEPGGYLFISGIDLDVRAKVAQDSGWEPVEELLEEIHEGDILRNDWPFRYFGLEPLDKMKLDWAVRYAAAFRIPENTETPSIQRASSAFSLSTP